MPQNGSFSAYTRYKILSSSPFFYNKCPTSLLRVTNELLQNKFNECLASNFNIFLWKCAEIYASLVQLYTISEQYTCCRFVIL